MPERKPLDEMPYGFKGQKHKDPKLLKRYEGEHPDLKKQCIIEEYEDGYIIYRDIETKTFLPGGKTWGAKKARGRGLSIQNLVDQVADSETWLAVLLHHFALTKSKDQEVSLRAINSILDRYFGKPVQNQSIEVGSKDGEAIKAKLNDLFGIDADATPLDGDNATDPTDSNESEAQPDSDKPDSE